VTDALAARALSPATTVLLVLGLVAAVLPHAWHLRAPVVIFFAAAAALRLLLLLRPGVLPGRLVMLALFFAGVATVQVSYGLAPSKDAGVALLTVMLGLKLLEVRTRRDVYVTVILGWFVLVTQVLYDQGLALAGFLMLPFLAFTFLLARLHYAGPVSPAATFAVTLRLTVYAVPIAGVLFVLFPRLGGPLWGFGVDQGTAATGLSDTMTPGSFSRVVQSTETAFRVRFDGEPPPPAERYWRGPVLWQTDGRTWSAGELPDDRPTPVEALSEPVFYEVTLEPHRRRWLFGLDLPLAAPGGGRLRPDRQIQADRDVVSRQTYALASVTRYRTGAPTAAEWRLALQLPDKVSQRMRALAEGWRRQASNPAEIVDQALAMFRDEPFVYTLAPPPLGDDPADSFLFETRRGFCEHFSSSFVLLMRVAGVPARVVTGYQGGELNPRGDYFLVRQSDAHAWAEVWLAETGWLRVDPTAHVAPERVESPIDPGRSLAEGRVAFNVELSWLRGLTRQVVWLVDAANLNWHRWVVGYDRERQHYLMRNLGLGGLHGYRLGLVAVGVAALVVLAVLFLALRGPRAGDPVVKAYARLCRKLSRAGVTRAPHEGPRDFLERAATALPQDAAALREIGRLYEQLRYGPGRPAAATHGLKRAVRRLRLAQGRGA
jgi:transglutaminase-like putative cysteine protease